MDLRTTSNTWLRWLQRLLWTIAMNTYFSAPQYCQGAATLAAVGMYYFAAVRTYYLVLAIVWAACHLVYPLAYALAGYTVVCLLVMAVRESACHIAAALDDIKASALELCAIFDTAFKARHAMSQISKLLHVVYLLRDLVFSLPEIPHTASPGAPATPSKAPSPSIPCSSSPLARAASYDAANTTTATMPVGGTLLATPSPLRALSDSLSPRLPSPINATAKCINSPVSPEETLDAELPAGLFEGWQANNAAAGVGVIAAVAQVPAAAASLVVLEQEMIFPEQEAQPTDGLFQVLVRVHTWLATCALTYFATQHAGDTLIELGRGGMGVVHLTPLVSLEMLGPWRFVCKQPLHPIKAPPPTLSAADGEALHWRCRRAGVAREVEMQQAAQRVTPFVVRAYAFDAVSCAILMEYCAKGDLMAVLKASLVSDLDYLRFLLFCMLSALNKLHQHGILHRDIKPQNILLHDIGASAGVPLLADFGLAKWATGPAPFTPESVGGGNGSSWPCCISEGHCGTLRYTAPEVREQRGLPLVTYTAQADVYSMGLVGLMCACSYLGLPLPDTSDEAFSAAKDEVLQLLGAGDAAAGQEQQGAEEVQQRAQLGELLAGLLAEDPAQRLSAQAALQQGFIAQGGYTEEAVEACMGLRL